MEKRKRKPQAISGTAKQTGFTQHLKHDFVKNKYIYFMLVPVVLYFVIFHYIPMFGAQIAFKDFSISKGIMRSPWVGFKHFTSYFNSYYFERLIKNTVVLSAYNILFGFPAPILLAILINEVQRVKNKVDFGRT